MLPENPTIDQVRDFFANDKFATEAAGCTIVEAARGHAMCEMPLEQIHYLAIACNVNEQPTVSVSNTIEFLSAAKGDKLIAECTVDKSGRKLGFYTVDVSDDTGRKVARMTATCYR